MSGLSWPDSGSHEAGASYREAEGPPPEVRSKDGLGGISRIKSHEDFASHRVASRKGLRRLATGRGRGKVTVVHPSGQDVLIRYPGLKPPGYFRDLRGDDSSRYSGPPRHAVASAKGTDPEEECQRPREDNGGAEGSQSPDAAPASLAQFMWQDTSMARTFPWPNSKRSAQESSVVKGYASVALPPEPASCPLP